MGVFGKKITFVSVFILFISAHCYATESGCALFLNSMSSEVNLQTQNPKTQIDTVENYDDGQKVFKAFEKALPLSLDLEINVSVEDLKKFKVPSKLMTALKRIIHNRGNTFEFIIWVALERKFFNSKGNETTGYIGHVEKSYNLFIDEYKKNPVGHLYTTVIKGKFDSANAKKALARELKRYEYLLSETYGEPIDLFEESGWTKVFEIKDLSELNARIDENYHHNRDLYKRIKEKLNAKLNPGTYYFHLTEEFFGLRQMEFKNDAHGFLVRNVTPELISELILELRLGDRLEKKYLDLVEFMTHFQTDQDYRIPFALTLIFFKAYLEVNEHIMGFTNINIKERSFYPQLLLGIKSSLHHKKVLRVIEDERYSNYINRSDALNAKHRDLENKILDLKNRYPQNISEISRLETALGRIPEINDFNDDLESIEQDLNHLETQRDELTEKILETVTKESIIHFEDLNFRWERLIPDRTYEVKGLDYNSVVFSKNVVDRFHHQALTGARFLAAFSKSYVSMKKSTGLRKIPALHTDFRDIKVIKTGNKIRIVGRLVGKTIYFYYIYEEDRPYDNKFMFQLIDNFKPLK